MPLLGLKKIQKIPRSHLFSFFETFVFDIKSSQDTCFFINICYGSLFDFLYFVVIDFSAQMSHQSAVIGIYFYEIIE